MAGIIKADRWSDAPTTLRSAAFNFEDVATRADRYLATVQQQAERIVASAKAQAEQIAEEARQEGYQRAVQEAHKMLGETLDEQLATLVPALQQAVEDIGHSRASWIRHWERETVRLAAAIAERVIRRELCETPEVTVELIREALELAMGSGDLTIQLHPRDYEALRDRTDAITDHLHTVGSADVVPNDGVSPGGCRVVTEFGLIDQTIEAQLDRITEELA